MATLSKRSAITTLGIALTVLMAACGGGEAQVGEAEDSGALADASLTIGSKAFTESILLAQITLLALEDAGAEVEDRTGISGSATVREALETGEIDMYWEYTGTGWVNILGNTTQDDPGDLYQAVADADAENGIAWLEPAPVNNNYAIAVTSEFAEENSLATLSDAAAFVEENPGSGAVCAASEFITRDDGLPGIEGAYGFEFPEVVELDLNLIYTQVGKTCSFGEVFVTDGRIIGNDLAVLEDDEDYFLVTAISLTLRTETSERYPEIADVVTPISQALNDEVMTDLNAQVDVEGRETMEVARDWLESEGLLD